MSTRINTRKIKYQKGFGLAEIIVFLLVISIVVVLALPQITASRRQTRFSAMQRQIVAFLNEARQNAMSQNIPITFRYDDIAKRIVIFGGNFGALGDTKNKTTDLSGANLTASEIVYGRPGSAPESALPDTSDITPLVVGAVNITFQSDGSVFDAAGNQANNALFFYNSKNSQTTAFAISILGAGGRVKLWRYSKNIKLYVE